jgi:Zn-dependent oligopeptidase
MLENWCYDAEVLKEISGHYQNLSTPLPENLRQRLVDAKVYFIALPIIKCYLEC